MGHISVPLVVGDGDDRNTSKLHVTNSVFWCSNLVYIGDLKTLISTANWSDPHTAHLLTSEMSAA